MRRPESFSFGVFTDAHITAVDGVSDSPFNVNSYSNTRYQAAIKMMNSLGLDFALNLGDMVHPLPQSREYITAAKRYFELSSQLNCVHYNIPGNHDIGDKPSKWVPAAEISSSGMEIYKSQFGTDHQAFSYKDWRFILLNAELFNSNLAENQNQKDWFVQELKKIENGRAFVALHYPPFLYSPDEFDHYDNLGNPDREWFLKKINDYKVTAVLSGHVHNFWLNKYSDTNLIVIPSTSFVRQDYAEMYGAQSPLEGGRDDINKLGFMKIDISQNTASWKFYRTFGGEFPEYINKPVTHCPKEHRNPSFGVDCRLPWITHHQIPPSGALDEFYRKETRNDYPFLALYELGINRLRLPLNDIFQKKIKQRLIDLEPLSFEYTFYCLSTNIQQLLEIDFGSNNCINCLEVIWDGEGAATFQKTLELLRKKLGSKLLISPLHKGFGTTDDQGRHLHIINHGFSVNDLSNAKEFFPDIWRDSGLWEIIDGVVCEFDIIGASELDWEKIKGWEKENNAHLHILAKSRPMSPADKLTDEELFCDKIANLWAHSSGSSKNTTFFTDSFVEIDRGYFQRTGITDRLGNPLKAWHKIMRAT